MQLFRITVKNQANCKGRHSLSTIQDRTFIQQLSWPLLIKAAKTTKNLSPIKLFLGIILFFFSSCATPKLLKQHLETDDINALLDDYHKMKPRNQKIITDHLFNNHNYYSNTYGELLEFREKTIFDPLLPRYDSIITERENHILKVLDRYQDINDVATYFKSHTDEQDFLTPIIAGALLKNFKEYEYSDMRNVYRAFNGTSICDSIFPFYSIKRDSLLPLAMETVKNYCAAEEKLINAYKKEGRRSVIEIASNAYDKLIDPLLDYDIPDNTSKVKDDFQEMTSSYNPVGEIESKISEQTVNLIADINECRTDLIYELLGTSSVNGYKIGQIPVSVTKYPVKCPIDLYNSIASIENRGSSLGSNLLSIASIFITGFWGLAATALDIYNSAEEAKEQAREVSPYISSLAKKVYDNFKTTCYKEYDTSFNQVKKDIIYTQERLKNTIYENY